MRRKQVLMESKINSTGRAFRKCVYLTPVVMPFTGFRNRQNNYIWYSPWLKCTLLRFSVMSGFVFGL